MSKNGDDLNQARERNAWSTYTLATDLYHITGDLENASCIAREGLRASHHAGLGDVIFFFTQEDWGAEVARSIGLTDFGLIRIQKDAIDPDTVHWDNAAERAAAVSLYTTQDFVQAEYLEFVDMFGVNATDFYK